MDRPEALDLELDQRAFGGSVRKLFEDALGLAPDLEDVFDQDGQISPPLRRSTPGVADAIFVACLGEGKAASTARDLGTLRRKAGAP